jgi:hypothetical protein
LRSGDALGLRAQDGEVCRYRRIPSSKRHQARKRPSAARCLQEQPAEHSGAKDGVDPSAGSERASQFIAEAVPLLYLWIERPKEQRGALGWHWIGGIEEQHGPGLIGDASEVFKVGMRFPWMVQRWVRIASED